MLHFPFIFTHICQQSLWTRFPNRPHLNWNLERKLTVLTESTWATLSASLIVAQIQKKVQICVRDVYRRSYKTEFQLFSLQWFSPKIAERKQENFIFQDQTKLKSGKNIGTLYPELVAVFGICHLTWFVAVDFIKRLFIFNSLKLTQFLSANCDARRFLFHRQIYWFTFATIVELHRAILHLPKFEICNNCAV